jgi:hypothetical protein
MTNRENFLVELAKDFNRKVASSNLARAMLDEALDGMNLIAIMELADKSKPFKIALNEMLKE